MSRDSVELAYQAIASSPETYERVACSSAFFEAYRRMLFENTNDLVRAWEIGGGKMRLHLCGVEVCAEETPAFAWSGPVETQFMLVERARP